MLPDTLPAPGHGVFSQTGTFSKGGGLFSGTSFLAGTFNTVPGRCVVVGLGAVLGLNLLGAALFLFSAVLSFLILRLVSGSGGLNWLAGIGPILPSTSRKVFIFLIIVQWEQSLVFHGVHLINWGCPISPEYMYPLHGCDLYFYIYHFYWEFASKVTMQKVAFWLE